MPDYLCAVPLWEINWMLTGIFCIGLLIGLLVGSNKEAAHE